MSLIIELVSYTTIQFYHIKKITTNHQGYKITMYLTPRELYINDETIKHLIKHKNIRLITFDELTG